METVATLAVGLVVDMAGAFEQVDTGMGKLANVAATAGKRVAIGIGVGTAAVVAFAKTSVDAATSFESQMAILKVAASGAGTGMDVLHDAALRIGADNELIGITASQAADAMTIFYKAGLDTEDMFVDLNAYMEEGASLSGAMRAAIDLQAASELELAEASELVAVTMATYGLEASEATNITNSLVQAADASVANVSDLGVALSYVGPQAAAMNVPLEDTLTALALLSERGITGSRAGTALNRVLADLTKGTPKSTEALKNLGVAIYDMDGSMRPLPDILADLEAGMIGMTDAEKDAAMQAIFTTQGRLAMNAILESGIEGWQEMEGAMEGAASAEEVAAARTNTFAGTMEKLGGTIETLQIMAGEALLPVLGDLADIFNEFVGTYTPQITAAFETFAGIVGQVIEVAQTFFGDLAAGVVGVDYPWEDVFPPWLADIAYFLTDIYTAIQPFVSGLVDLVSGFVEWKDVLIGVGGVLAAVIIPLLWSVLSPLLALGAAVAAAIAVVALLRNAWESDFGGIRTFVGDALEFIRNLWETVASAFREAGIGEAVDALKDAFGELWAAVQPILQDLWELVGELWEAVKEAFGGSGEDTLEFAEVVKNVADIVVDAIERLAKNIKKVAKFMDKLWEGHGKNITKVIENTFKIILKIVTTTVKVLVKIVKMWMKIFNGEWEDAWEIAKDILSDIWDAIIKIIELAADNIKRFIDSWLKILLGLIEKGWKAIQNVIEDVWEAIQDFIDDVTEAIKRGIDAWLKVLESLIRAGMRAIQDLIEDVWNAIKSFIDNVTDAIKGIVDSWMDALESLIKSGWNAIQNVTETVWNAIKSFIDTTTNAIKSLLDSWMSSIKTMLESGWNTIKTMVENAWNSIKTTIENAANSIKSTLDSWIDSIRSTIQSGLDAIESAVSSAWDSIESTISNAADSIKSTIDSWLNTIKSVWTDAWNSLKDIVATAWENVKTFVSDGISGLADVVRGLVGTLNTIGADIVENIRVGIASAWYRIVTEFEKIKDKVSTAVSNAASGIISAGGRIVDYIKDGIRNAWSSFVDWLKDKIVGIFGASEPLDVTSPFRSARLRRIGKRVGEEIVAGIVSERTNIARAIQSELGAAVSGISGLSGAAFATTAGGTYQAGPFYTTINTQIEENEFLFRVQQAVRTLQERGET